MANSDSEIQLVRVPGKAEDYDAALAASAPLIGQWTLLSDLPHPEREPHRYDHLGELASCLLPTTTIYAGIEKFQSVIVETLARFVAKAAGGDPDSLALLVDSIDRADEPDEPSEMALGQVFSKRFGQDETAQLAQIAGVAISRLRAKEGERFFFEALRANYPEAQDARSAVLHHHVTQMFKGSAVSAAWVVEYGSTHADLNPKDFGKTWEDFFYASHGRGISVRVPERGKFV